MPPAADSNLATTNSATQRRPLPALFPLLLLWLLTLVAYYPATQAGWIWDDDSYITHNRFGRTLTELQHIWTDPLSVPQYYPVTHTVIWLQHQLYGNSALGYHTVNVLLHVLAATLLWRLLRRLELPEPAPWLAAAIFALHPVHVESVAWVTELKNVLSLSFYLMAALAYFRFRSPAFDPAAPTSPDPATAVAARKIAAAWYVLALLLFACAVMSKTVTSSLPAAILLVLYWKRGFLRWADVWPLVPMFVFGAIMGRFTAWLEVHHVGAQGVDWDLSFTQRLLIAGHAVWFYVAKLLWPHPLAAMYDRWRIDTSSLLQWAYPISAGLLVLVLVFLRNRIGRGPLVAALFFGGTLLPALGFFDVFPMRYSFVADHFQYHASLGVIVLIAAGLSLLWHQSRLVPRPVLVAVVALLVLILAQRTWTRSWLFHDDRTLWTDTLANYPRVTFGRYILANYARNEGRPDEALQHHLAAVEAEPNMAHTHVYLAQHYWASSRKELAAQTFEHAIALYPRPEPDQGAALFQLGQVYEEIKQPEKALQAYLRATQSMNRPAGAHEHAGRLLSQKNDWRAAAEQFFHAAQLEPNNARAQYNLGTALQQIGQIQPAQECFERALALNPRHVDAAKNLSILLASSGRLPQGIAVLEKALTLAPDDVSLHVNLCMMLTHLGQFDRAREQLVIARRLSPDSPAVARAAALLESRTAPPTPPTPSSPPQ